jgi:hypothetical protein
MRPRAPSLNVLAVLAVLSAALPGCQDPDVGSRCQFSWGGDPTTPPPTPDTALGDYFETGNTACDDLVCIVSPVSAASKYGTCDGDACGYCSKPCVSDDDCFKDETGLVCSQLILDPAFLATLDEETKQRFLAEVRFTSYCVAPR